MKHLMHFYVVFFHLNETQGLNLLRYFEDGSGTPKILVKVKSSTGLLGYIPQGHAVERRLKPL